MTARLMNMAGFLTMYRHPPRESRIPTELIATIPLFLITLDLVLFSTFVVIGAQLIAVLLLLLLNNKICIKFAYFLVVVFVSYLYFHCIYSLSRRESPNDNGVTLARSWKCGRKRLFNS